MRKKRLTRADQSHFYLLDCEFFSLPRLSQNVPTNFVMFSLFSVSSLSVMIGMVCYSSASDHSGTSLRAQSQQNNLTNGGRRQNKYVAVNILQFPIIKYRK
jgi:hypothetical protein